MSNAKICKQFHELHVKNKNQTWFHDLRTNQNWVQISFTVESNYFSTYLWIKAAKCRRFSTYGKENKQKS